jgi:hypothetical protein
LNESAEIAAQVSAYMLTTAANSSERDGPLQYVSEFRSSCGCG